MFTKLSELNKRNTRNFKGENGAAYNKKYLARTLIMQISNWNQTDLSDYIMNI